MDILPSTPKAAKEIGSPQYFTGIPCKRGHVAPRNTRNATCSVCWSMGIYRGDREANRIANRKRNQRIRLASRGGCTPEMKEALIEAQEGKCAICESSAKKLFVDHCHTENKIRAALCINCNTALGHAKDNPNTLRKMASYIEKHRSN